MREQLTLKRGWGRSFCGENWKLCGDDKWEDHPMYVPNGREPFHGFRTFDGVEFAVFRCLNDDFYAQPVETCLLPVPEDPLLVLSVRPGEARPEAARPARRARKTPVPIEVQDDQPAVPPEAPKGLLSIEQMDD